MLTLRAMNSNYVNSDSDFKYVAQCKLIPHDFNEMICPCNNQASVSRLHMGRTDQGCTFWNTLIKSANLLTNQKHVQKYNMTINCWVPIKCERSVMLGWSRLLLYKHGYGFSKTKASHGMFRVSITSHQFQLSKSLE